MRYIGRDQEHIYLKCRHCKKICEYDRKQFEKKQSGNQQSFDSQKFSDRIKRHRINGKCTRCNKEFHIIWGYPLSLPKYWYKNPLFIMTGLFCLMFFMLQVPLFKENYLFNKIITSLNPMLASLFLSALCYISTIVLDIAFSKVQAEPKQGTTKKPYVLLVGMAIEGILFIFALNTIIQEQYQSLQIKNPETSEIQQYYGNAVGNVASGEGRLFDSQGELIYMGGFKNNLYHGYGRKREPVKTIRNTEISQSYQYTYKGEYKEGLRDGEGEEYLYDMEYDFEKEKGVPPYLHYTGQFENDKYCGTGTLYGVDDKYEGGFSNNQRFGYGEYWFLDSDDEIYKVVGIYTDDKVNGEAKKYSANDALCFEGTYEDGIAISGTFYYRNGERMYEGKCDGNYFEGRGTSYREDGSKEYAGYWEDDQYDGWGTLYYGDGETIKQEGDFSEGVLNGHGIQNYENGKLKYEGDWVSGLWEGNGIWKWENGKTYYDGTFKNGEPDGKGTEYTVKEKKRYKGGFSDGERNGFGTSYDPETEEIEKEGQWKDGSYMGEEPSNDEDEN